MMMMMSKKKKKTTKVLGDDDMEQLKNGARAARKKVCSERKSDPVRRRSEYKKSGYRLMCKRDTEIGERVRLCGKGRRVLRRIGRVETSAKRRGLRGTPRSR